MERKVWVAHKKPGRSQPDWNLKKAETFGEVKILMEDIDARVNIFKDGKLTYRLYQKLKKSTPDDLVLLSGDRIPVAMVVSIFVQLHGKINVLFWNQKKNRYEIRKNFTSIEKYLEKESS